MMMLFRVLSLVACVFASSCFATETMKFQHQGTDFKIWFNQQGPTKISFEILQKMTVVNFRTDGRISRVRAGQEVYAVRYNADGDVRKVNQKQSSARFLTVLEGQGDFDKGALTEYGRQQTDSLQCL